MDTPHPTAWATLALFELGNGPLNMIISRGLGFNCGCPANPFVARQWRNVVPGGQSRGLGYQGFSQICREFVCRTFGNFYFSHDLILPQLASGQQPALDIIRQSGKVVWCLERLPREWAREVI